MDGPTPKPPPAPAKQPLVGHTFACLRSPLSALERWGAADEDVLDLRIAGQQFCLVTTPDAVEQVLATDAASYRKADLVRDRLGTLQSGSLVLLEGAEWRDRRQLLRESVTDTRLTAASSATVQAATELVSEWPSDQPIDVADHARTLSLSVLASALFGLELQGDETPIHRAADDILARMELRSISTYLPEWVPTPTNRRYRRAVETLHDELDELIELRVETDPAGDDLPSVLARAGVPAETIRNELIAFLFAGYDSTATALSCTLGLLGDHPEIQADLRRELETLPAGQPPQPEALSELSLLDAVIRESLRLYPPQYLLFREPTTTVQLAGYRIEAGTPIVIPPWTLHRDPQFWDEPTAFRPDRWLGEDAAADRPPYAYLPYGRGPRYCLGRRMAEQLLTTVTAIVCRRRRLELVGSLSVAAGPTLALEDGVELRASIVR